MKYLFTILLFLASCLPVNTEKTDQKKFQEKKYNIEKIYKKDLKNIKKTAENHLFIIFR